MGFLMEFLRTQGRKLGGSRKPGPRIDQDFPFKMQIGGFIQFDKTPFIISTAAGLVVGDCPSTRKISAYGKIRAEGFTIHRAYLQDGDREVDYILQVVTAPDGKIDGVPRLYRLHEEIFPGSAEDWTVWLPNPKKASDSYQIGVNVFGLHDAKGDTIGEYRRWWPTPETDAFLVKPREFSETLFTSPYEGSSVRVRHQAMLYGLVRERPQNFPAGEVPAEWVLLSASEYPGEAFVHIHVGVDLEPRHLRVLPPAAAAA